VKGVKGKPSPLEGRELKKNRKKKHPPDHTYGKRLPAFWKRVDKMGSQKKKKKKKKQPRRVPKNWGTLTGKSDVHSFRTVTMGWQGTTNRGGEKKAWKIEPGGGANVQAKLKLDTREKAELPTEVLPQLPKKKQARGKKPHPKKAQQRKKQLRFLAQERKGVRKGAWRKTQKTHPSKKAKKTRKKRGVQKKKKLCPPPRAKEEKS